MNLTVKTLISLLLLVGVFSQGYSQVYQRKLPSDQFFQKIVGSWKLKGKPTLEQWIKSSSGVYQARVVSLKTGDSILTETIKIVYDFGEVYFEAKVLNQNEGKPIRFQLVKRRKKRLKFANKTHDFPQYIEYQLIDKDKLKVQISGMAGNKLRKIDFNYERVK
ncbi:hypothetical protein BKI52_33430 [marine bacterium AO1-C]|nr:hypothetical protein BKI52_33430 [marine bacterium AO1-C]